jgi:carbon storage regulator
MLVLTRGPGDSIIIQGGIKVTVVSAGRYRTTLAIEAPADVPIHRQEVHKRIEAEEAQKLVDQSVARSDPGPEPKLEPRKRSKRRPRI